MVTGTESHNILQIQQADRDKRAAKDSSESPHMNSVTEATGECKLKKHMGGYFSNQRQFRVSSFKFRASAVVSPARAKKEQIPRCARDDKQTGVRARLPQCKRCMVWCGYARFTDNSPAVYQGANSKAHPM